MNVILNAEEVHAVIGRVTGQLVDQAGLSEEGREAVRQWRQHRTIGTRELDEFAVEFNEAMGNIIDERTTRMLRLKGGRYVTEVPAEVPARRARK